MVIQLAYTWEPRWEKIRIEAHGITVNTCRDRITGMISCPICIHALSKCIDPSIKPTYKTTNIFFFTPEDLLNHIREYHAKRSLRKIISREEDSTVSRGS